MSGMLASIMNLAEADIALSGGADIIDLKDPRNGALGALDITAIGAIVNKIAGRAPVSATVGDLPLDVEIMLDAVRDTAATGVDYVKIGFFSNSGTLECLRRMSGHLPRQARTIAVLFADLSPDWEILLPELKNAGFAGVMIDTADKRCGGLRRCMDDGELTHFVYAAKSLDLLTGLAGSLSQSDIAPLLETGADYLGFRTALCSQLSRTGSLDKTAFMRVRNRIPGTVDSDQRFYRPPSLAGAHLA